MNEQNKSGRQSNWEDRPHTLAQASVQSSPTRQTLGPVLGAPLLSSQGIQVKGLLRTMSPADRQGWFIRSVWDHTHHKHRCKPHLGSLWTVLLTEDRCAHWAPALLQRQLSWSCYLQHKVNVTRYSPKVSECELLRWHTEAERSGSDLQATACKYINPFKHTRVHVPHG